MPVSKINRPVQSSSTPEDLEYLYPTVFQQPGADTSPPPEARHLESSDFAELFGGASEGGKFVSDQSPTTFSAFVTAVNGESVDNVRSEATSPFWYPSPAKQPSEVGASSPSWAPDSPTNLPPPQHKPYHASPHTPERQTGQQTAQIPQALLEPAVSEDLGDSSKGPSYSTSAKPLNPAKTWDVVDFGRDPDVDIQEKLRRLNAPKKSSEFLASPFQTPSNSTIERLCKGHVDRALCSFDQRYNELAIKVDTIKGCMEALRKDLLDARKHPLATPPVSAEPNACVYGTQQLGPYGSWAPPISRWEHPGWSGYHYGFALPVSQAPFIPFRYGRAHTD